VEAGVVFFKIEYILECFKYLKHFKKIDRMSDQPFTRVYNDSVSAAHSYTTSTITTLRTQLVNQIEALEGKMTDMRDEHGEKLTELQENQQKQLETIQRNEERLQEIVDNQQTSINELNVQNSNLVSINGALSENQNRLSDFQGAFIGEFEKIMMMVCTKLQKLEEGNFFTWDELLQIQETSDNLLRVKNE